MVCYWADAGRPGLQLMNDSGWRFFSFCESLRPEPGWKIDHAILATYSADLSVIIAALLALSGCDCNDRRTGSRLELVHAIEKLRDRMRVLVHPGRVTKPKAPSPILAVLDKFLREIPPKARDSSWHPKAALLRFTPVDGVGTAENQWRLWIGSRNLTKSMNWEAGMVLRSRADGRGQPVDGVSDLGVQLARRADLANFPADRVFEGLNALTWECPLGTEVKSIRLLGEQMDSAFPLRSDDADRVLVISPFLDKKTVRNVSQWGGNGVRRTLLSTWPELSRLVRDDPLIFNGFEVLWSTYPELPGEGMESLEEGAVDTPAEATEGEEIPIAGLHAKLLYVAKGAHRQLWMGSANATARAWDGRNYEVVARILVTRPEATEALEEFVACCRRFEPEFASEIDDLDEMALEEARNDLAYEWLISQRLDGEHPVVVSSSGYPSIKNPDIQLDVASLGQEWVPWPPGSRQVTLASLRPWQFTDFLQVRLRLHKRTCEWIQLARFMPPIDQKRDHAVIAHYLDLATYFLWLRSILADEPRPGGGEWDKDDPQGPRSTLPAASVLAGMVPTLEEILRSWARNPAAFAEADSMVTDYLGEMERRATADDDLTVLSTFRKTWSAIVTGLK